MSFNAVAQAKAEGIVQYLPEMLLLEKLLQYHRNACRGRHCLTELMCKGGHTYEYVH